MKRACIAAALVLGLVSPSTAQDAASSYDFRERIRILAFDPARFFPEQPAPEMSVRYLGDDYGYPVYAIAVQRGCTAADQGDARRTCGERLTARMVRAPFEGKPLRPRARGQQLFATVAQAGPQNEDDLLRLLDRTGLEWLEADVGQCPTAMAHLATGRALKFSPALNRTDRPFEIILHADTVTFEVDEHLAHSRYEGWLKPGSPAVWADQFAASLETCWKPASAPVPWRAAKE